MYEDRIGNVLILKLQGHKRAIKSTYLLSVQTMTALGTVLNRNAALIFSKSLVLVRNISRSTKIQHLLMVFFSSIRGNLTFLINIFFPAHISPSLSGSRPLWHFNYSWNLTHTLRDTDLKLRIHFPGTKWNSFL